MNDLAVHFLLDILSIYGGLGILFTVVFLSVWIQTLDASAKAGTWGFRLLIIPGLLALWPLMLYKVWQSRKNHYAPPNADGPIPPRNQRRFHGWAFLSLALVIPLMASLSLLGRQSPFRDSHSVMTLLNEPIAQPLSIKLQPPATPSLSLSGLLNHDETWAEATLTLEVKNDPGGSAIALYWSHLSSLDHLPPDAVYLGGYWGPHRLNYALPRNAFTTLDQTSGTFGTLYFLRIGPNQELLGAYPLVASPPP